MSYAGKLGSITSGLFPTGLAVDSASLASESAIVRLPDAHLLFSGDFARWGSDLIISDHLHRMVVSNYFHGDKRPTLVSPEGAALDPNVIEALTGHVQYAQAAATASASKVVGHVVKLAGSASIVRNGTTIILNNGDAVYQNDVVQTGSGSSIGLVMVDGTTFNLSANARMMLNDLTYEATSTSNSSLFTLVQGAASFVAGQVAKTGDMKVGTPVATMGIRGTAVILDISSADGKVSISVIDQRDGQQHSVEVFNTRGDLIGTVTSTGSGLTLTPAGNFQVITQDNNKTAAQIAAEFNAFQLLLQTYDAGKALFPDLPQHTDANPNTTRYASGSTGSTSPATEYHSPESGTAGGETSTGIPAALKFAIFSPADPTPLIDTNSIITAQVAKTGVAVTTTASLVEDASTATSGTLATGSNVTFQPVPAAAKVGVYGSFTFDESTGAWTYALNSTQADSLAAGQIVHETLTVASTDTTSVIDVTITGTNDIPVLTAGTVANGSIEVSAQTSTLTPGAAALLRHGPGLIEGLTGNSGYGIQALSSGDDNSSDPIDITSVFGPGGINFFGHSYTSIYINNNGNITFGAPSSSYTPTEIDAGFGNPIIAVFWADVDTRTAGNVYYDMDPVDGVMTITWDHVGYYNQHSDMLNSFQIMLVNEGYGNFDIVYRYGDIQWTTGDASGGAPARAGYSAGDGVNYFELPQSGNVSALLALPETVGNTSIAGVGQFDVRNGVIAPSILTTTGTINFSDVDLSDVHTVTSVVYTGGGDQLGNLTLVKAADTTGTGMGGQYIWTYTADPQTVSAALLAASAHSKTETFDVTISDGHGGTINQTVSVSLTASNFAPVAAAVTLAPGNEDIIYVISEAALLAGVIDVDGPALSITALSVASGGGTIVSNDNGTWSYTPATNYNGPVSFKYTASDGSLSSSSTASLSLAAVNDLATISGIAIGSVVEDVSTTISGRLMVQDLDSGEAVFQLPPAVALVGVYGNFTFDETTGAWSYALGHSQADSLIAGQFAHDSLVVTSADSSASQIIDVVITGTNDVPVIAGVTNAPAQEVVTLDSVVPAVLDPAINVNSHGFNTETFDNQSRGLASNNGAGFGPFYSVVLDATFSGWGNAGVVQGSFSGVTAPPFIGPLPGANDTTNYLSIGAAGTEIISFASLKNAFGLYWGSVDAFNTISFYHGATLVAAYTGADVVPLFSDGNQASFSSNGYVEFAGFGLFDKVVLTSSFNAFEVDNISAGLLATSHVQLGGPITGTIIVSDEDIGDTLSASVVSNAVISYNGSASLPSNIDIASLIDAGAVTFDTALSDGGAVVLNWIYNPTTPNLDFLRPGDTLNLIFSAQVNDGHGNVGNQPLTIAIVGSAATDMSQDTIISRASLADTLPNAENGLSIFGGGQTDIFEFDASSGRAGNSDLFITNDTIAMDHSVFACVSALAGGQPINFGHDMSTADTAFNATIFAFAGATVEPIPAHHSGFHLV